MSRLENLLPVAASVNNFTQEGSSYRTLVQGRNVTLTVFEKQVFDYCRGTYAVKEIALMLYNKVEVFCFTQYYEVLRKLAEQDLLRNKEQLLAAMAPPQESKTAIVPTARTREDLVINLRKINLFANLPLETLNSIASVAEQKVYKNGEAIIKKDTVGDEVFVLLSGEVGVYASFYLVVKGAPLATLKPVSVFGESAAVSGKKRTADVVATMESLVLKFSIKKIADKSDGKDLNKNLKIRLVFQQLVRMHPVFKKLPGDIIQMLLNSCTVEKIPAHKTVVQQGEKGQSFYFILSGSVQVIKNRIPEARLSVGTYFGEVGALLKQARTASIVTETDCVFLVLTEKNFINLLASNMMLALAVEKEILARNQVAVAPEEPTIEDTQEITQNIRDLQVDDFGKMSFNDDTTPGVGTGVKPLELSTEDEPDFAKLSIKDD